ncbi:hypothetical protein D9C73_016631 [Collichthys lucidus]|uniref:Uncharacterized protein n=1 Tax=Collichthys lucidus TaxID=240159 RepID=A0A4V6ARU5_COLLU|nr:hypothetical protein D9C73_016631 [Collichthys lucidus]
MPGQRQQRCLVTLAPVISPLPFVVEQRKREGERERLQPTTTMSPEAPCLLAPPAAQYSCGSVPDPDQLGSQPCQRATRTATVCESSSPLSH